MSLKSKRFAFDKQAWRRTTRGSNRVLGLPVENVWAAWTAVAVTLGYYIMSGYPDLSVWDSPLIALVAIQGGLGHPPGYPLHTLLGTMMSHLPGVGALAGVKLLSSIPGALMCVPMLSLAAQMKSSDSSAASLLGPWIAAAFVILLCLHPVLWDPATRVEVYSLAAFFACWGVARLGVAFSSLAASSASSGHLRRRGFFIAGLALGASASVNPVVAAITATVVLATTLKSAVHWALGRRAILTVIAGGLVGLLPYVWIPIIASRTDRLVWGAPTDITSMWNFLRAQDFAANVRPDAPTVVSHIFDWIGWSVFSGTLIFVAIGLAGWLLLGKRGSLGRNGPVALVFAVLAICNNKVWVPENPDYLGYLCGPIAICAAGAVALLSHLGSNSNLRYRFITIGCLVMVSFASFCASPAVYSRSRNIDRTARLQAQGALNESAKDGILVVGSDHLGWPLLYLQEIEHVRPDVVVLPEGMAAGSSWYWKYLYNRHPTLRPFDTYEPGDKVAQVQRFLKLHADRHVAFESLGLARRAGLKIYGVGWLLEDRLMDASTTEQVTEKIEKAAAAIGAGSPNGAGTLSLLSYLRGAALWHLGLPKAAFRAFLAGVPPSLRPDLHPPEEHWQAVPPLRQVIPSGLSATRGLGEPQRNVDIARYLAVYDGSTQSQRSTSPAKP